MDRRRVVVTGMGIICPVGNSLEEAWRNAREGVSGIATIQRVNTSDLQVHFGGEVKNFDAKALFGHREVRRMDRVTQLAMTAALEAARESGLNMANEDPHSGRRLVRLRLCGHETTLCPANVPPE